VEREIIQATGVQMDRRRRKPDSVEHPPGGDVHNPINADTKKVRIICLRGLGKHPPNPSKWPKYVLKRVGTDANHQKKNQGLRRDDLLLGTGCTTKSKSNEKQLPLGI